ncbi:MAG: hypothetical protein ABSB49_04965 [Polyangia bacterium]
MLTTSQRQEVRNWAAGMRLASVFDHLDRPFDQFDRRAKHIRSDEAMKSATA